MKRQRLFFMIILALFTLTLSACLGFLTGAGDSSESVKSEVEKAISETNAFETEVSQRMTSVAKKTEDAAPPSSDTPIPSPTNTTIPSPTNTPIPLPSDTPTLEPTPENPWVMQSWCLEHIGCGKVKLINKTDYWAQVTLTYIETGQTKFFSGRPNATDFITLKNGMYKYVFNFCGGEQYFEGYHSLNRNWSIVAKCNY